MRVAAVDRERNAGHEVRAGEEAHRVGGVPYLADPSQGMDPRRGRRVAGERGPDDARGERVHADVVPRELGGERDRERVDAALARQRGRDRDRRLRLVHERRPDVDDRPAAPLDHERHDRLGHQIGPLHVGREVALEVFDGALEERLRAEDARAVHEHVNAAEALACGGSDGLPGRRLAHVPGDRDDAPLFAEAPARPLELLPVLSVDEYARPLGKEAARQVEADAAAPARDDDSIDSVGPWFVLLPTPTVPRFTRTRKSYVSMDSIT